jgi:hypothetical protein
MPQIYPTNQVPNTHVQNLQGNKETKRVPTASSICEVKTEHARPTGNLR